MAGRAIDIGDANDDVVEALQHRQSFAQTRPGGFAAALDSSFVRSARELFLSLFLCAAGCSVETVRPNLLLVTIDTLRADALACYGGAPDVGARLCEIGSEGTRFDWAFSTAPTTSPSIASVLTSRWVPDHGVTQNLRTQLAADVDTVAEVLKRAGYTTAAVVSNPLLHPGRRLDQGFDHYDARMTRRERNRPGFAERAAQDTTDAAIDRLDAMGTGPWFLWVHYQDPHGPYEAPGIEPARDEAGDATLPVLAANYGRGGIPEYQLLPGVRTLRAYRRSYEDEIRHLDAHLARLLDRVDATTARPGILLTSDHGEAFGEDDRYFAHGHSTGLEQLRVPLLWRAPSGQEPAAPRSSAVGLVDVAPTLLSAAGLAPPPGFVGHALQDPPAQARTLFAESARRAAALRGNAFFARDRDPKATHTAEGKPWGAEHPALPTRSATLPDALPLPGYRRRDHDAELEASLTRYLGEERATPAVRDGEITPELRRQLEALGYFAE